MGTTSRFDQRDTGRTEASPASSPRGRGTGIDRENWTDLQPLTLWPWGFATIDRVCSSVTIKQRMRCNRHDHQGGWFTGQRRGVYRSASILVMLCFWWVWSASLHPCWSALRQPSATLSGPGLGRRSYVPSESISMRGGLLDVPAKCSDFLALAGQTEIVGKASRETTGSFESEDGSGCAPKMDHRCSSWRNGGSGARFGAPRNDSFPRR